MLLGEGNFSGVGNKHFFLGCWTGPVYRVSAKMVGSREELGQSIHGGGNKQDERRGNIFGKMGSTGGIIQANNSAGH